MSNGIGLILAFLGIGMELIRPALYRWQLSIPKWIDTVLGFGGIVYIAVGCFLAWGLISANVHLQTPISISPPSVPRSTPWPDAFVFAGIVVSSLWAAVRLPARLIPQTYTSSPTYFNLGFMAGRLKHNVHLADESKLASLRDECRRLSLIYTAAKLTNILDAIDTGDVLRAVEI